ncbi:MAG: metallophosphoesterase [Deltaproteobacteria bacterium]|nr:metallophosphoesterase [Candidatus Zymogenaceae bacterium]
MKSKIVFLGLFILLIVSLTFLLSSVFYTASKERIPTPPLLGNGEDIIASLHEDAVSPRPFSIFLVGDTQVSGYFEQFYTKTDMPSLIDFGIILGDFVRKPEDEYHTFFIMEFSEWGLAYPILLVPGNHDMAVTDKYLAREGAFTREDFERTYGPRNVSFMHAGCLFIIVDNIYNTDYISYIRDALSQRPEGTLMTFVFMHVPPQSLSPLVECRGIDMEEEFFSIIEEYDVDYVICGDYHSYLESEYGDTGFIITGGGGAELDGENEYSFYHSVFLSIDPVQGRVDQRIYPIAKTFELFDEIEIFMMCVIYPLFAYHFPIFSAVILLNLVLLVTCGILIRRSRAGSSR